MYDSLVNHGDYLSAHYLAEVLPKDLKAKDGLLARWTAAEEAERRRHTEAVAEARREGADTSTVPPRARTPREGLRALHGPYFAGRAAFEQDAAALTEPGAPEPTDWPKRLTDLHLATLRALGFTGAHEQAVTVHRADHEYTVQAAHAEPGLVAVSCGWTAQPDAALDPEGPGRLLHPAALDASARLTDGKALTDFLFECDEPPRYVLLLVGGVLVLADRMAWHDGRYLAVSLDTALNRRDDRGGGELDTVAALFGADSLRVPEEGGTAPLAAFVDRSGKHAVGVSTELREGLRLSVEWIANEVLARLREQGVRPEQLDDPARLARRLSRESLRYLYRILFLLYAEAQPALGILPADYPEYQAGYGLQRLGDLVVRDLVGERSRQGFHLYESLDVLFRMVDTGHPAEASGDSRDGSRDDGSRDDGLRDAPVSVGVGLRFEPLRSELFARDSVRLIGNGPIDNPRHAQAASDRPSGEASDEPEFVDTRLRNATLHRVLRRLMLTKGRRGERGGFISYAQLGINQLGAVYEGLMSYSGFIAEEDLYEVAKGGDPSGGSWMIPASRVQDYPDEVFVNRTDDDTGLPHRVVHPTGSFVYRLAGRDRQTSASYYTPESLTRVTVELALRHRLTEETTARELLEWTICEPALGSGAFLNEAVNQVAEEYLRRRERELGLRVDTEQRQIELQKVKAYIALHNAYGVDLNATAVELAEVSLWLNTMHPGMRAPWFGFHLRRGNSLIGAGRKVYAAEDLPGGAWLKKKDPLPPRELPFRDGGLPEGAVHQFLLPAVGWGAVAGEAEAKKLAPEAAKQLAAWRRAIQRAPRKKTDLRRIQGIARRVEFLWDLVEQRLKLSEAAVARRVDVWRADWLEQTDQAVDKQRILDDLTAIGTPYWRLKKVMDAWCALWFWPLDRVAELDGTAAVYAAYAAGGGVVTESEVAALLAPLAAASAAAEVEVAAAPPTGPAPGDLEWEKAGLFDDPDGEQARFAVDPDADEAGSGSGSGSSKPAPGRRTGGRTARIVDQWRDCIPLQGLGDWLDFLECLVGRADMPKGALTFASLDDLGDYERTLAGPMGMDPTPHRLASRFPWLDTVEDIAGPTEKEIQAEDGHGFFHWELHFAHVFKGKRGGFDLQVGNPPWVRPEWLENQVLAERDPWFMLTEKPSATDRQQRKDALLEGAAVLTYYLGERASVSGTSEFLGARVVYPVLWKTRPDLYRAFMCRVWDHFAARGVAGLIHPDTHFGGVNEGRLRSEAYRHLRLHAGFVNVGNWAFEASRNTEFGVHIYSSGQSVIRFNNLSRLYGVDPLVASLDHDGTGEVPGMRRAGGWDLRPHQARVIQVDEGVLREWRQLTGETDALPGQAALLQPTTTEEQGAIAALSAVEHRLGEYEPWISQGYNETNGKKGGFITWDTSQPDSLADLVLQGPHFGIATPISKQPKVPCRGNHDWTGYDLTTLHARAVPRTNYVRPETCSRKRYEENQDPWPDRARLDPAWRPSAEEWARRSEVLSDDELMLPADDQRQLLRGRMRFFRPYTQFYRLAWRRMIPFNTERSLFAAVIPPGPAHIDAVNSLALADNRATALNAGFWASLPVDYLLRITGRSDLRVAEAKKMPYADPTHPLAGPLLLRTLRLNCVTEAYAPLWEELYDMTWPAYEGWAMSWPRLAPLAGHLRPTWEYVTPLRTEYERRAALVELDALVAVWLGMSADELIAIHKARYAILADRESEMWFDAQGRQVARDPYAHGHGQTKEHYEQFLAYDKGERAEPPEGYTAPFYKADREQEMRAAHAHFEARLKSTQ